MDSHNFMEVMKVEQNFIFNTSDTSIIDIFFYLTGNLWPWEKTVLGEVPKLV